MIEVKRHYREAFWPLGSVVDTPEGHYILYDYYDNDIDFVEIWLRCKFHA